MIDLFAQHQRFRGFTPATVRRRTETLEQFARYIEPIPLAEATRQFVEDFLSTKRAARTRHAYRSDLRVFYVWALERGMIEVDPACKVESIKVPKSLPRPIDRDVAAYGLLVGLLRTRRMFGLALFAGLRCHEIAALRAEDVWTQVDAAVIVIRNGKGGKDRVIPIHPVLSVLLVGLPASGPLFPGGAGETMRPASVSRAIARHMSACGIVGTPHQLRHTFGTELARVSNGDMVYTAALMGHASMSTTMGYVRLAHQPGSAIVDLMYGGAA